MTRAYENKKRACDFNKEKKIKNKKFFESHLLMLNFDKNIYNNDKSARVTGFI